MGGYSGSSDEDRKRKKKKKKRSLSRSRETSVESSISSRKSGKHKSKKKKRQRSRSRSRSPEVKQRRRSRSYSREKSYRSTSKSRGYKRSRSRSYDRRRSRSRSRSYGRDRRSKRSRSPSHASYSRRSYSRERRSRSRSVDRRRRRSRSRSYDNGQKKDKDDPCSSVPGFADMTPADQARVRMQLALKAAAAADEKLKEQGVLLNPKAAMSAGEQKRFNKAIEKIEKESFVPAPFTSSGDKPAFKDDQGFGRSNLEKTHDSAIFGSGKLDMKLDPSERTNVVYTGATSLAHPNLNKTAEEKMGRWIEKLTAMRKKKMEGDSLL